MAIATVSDGVVERMYPGSDACPEDMLALAGEFERAAIGALANYRSGSVISAAPYRLLAIHAVELYLNAFLRHAGETAPAIRGLQHNLTARLDLTDKHQLVFRSKTRQHLHDISLNREYLMSRYAPDAQMFSQLNRLQATLLEVSEKVRSRLGALKHQSSVA